MNTGQDPSKDRPSPVVIEKLDRRQRKNRRIPGKDHFHLAVLAAADLSPAALRCPHAAPYALHENPPRLICLDRVSTFLDAPAAAPEKKRSRSSPNGSPSCVFHHDFGQILFFRVLRPQKNT